MANFILCKDPDTGKVVTVCNRQWESTDPKKARCCICAGQIINLKQMTMHELLAIKKAVDDEIVTVQGGQK